MRVETQNKGGVEKKRKIAAMRERLGPEKEQLYDQMVGLSR